MPLLESLTVPLDLDNSKFVAGLKNSRAGLKKFGLAVAGVSTALGAIGLRGAVAIDEIEKGAGRAQSQVRAFDALNVSAAQSDVSVADLSKGLAQLNKITGDAINKGGAAAEAFEDLGIEVNGFSRLTPVKQFSVLADALNATTNGSLKASAGSAILGGSYKKLLPLINLGSKGFQANADFASNLGLLLDKDLAGGAVNALDAFTRVNIVLDNFGRLIASTVGPDITNFINGTLENLPGILAGIRAAFVSVGTAIAGLARIAVTTFQIMTGRLDQIPELFRRISDLVSLTGSAFNDSIATSLSRRQDREILTPEAGELGVVTQPRAARAAQSASFGVVTNNQTGRIDGLGAAASQNDIQIRELLERIAVATESGGALTR